MSKKILVIDDDEAIVEAIQIMLETTGYSVKTSTNGEILKKISSDVPDLILLDIWMNGTDGRDILDYIHSKPEIQHVPVVMISANKDTEKIAKKAGATDFLSKPFEMQDLLNTVEKYTNHN